MEDEAPISASPFGGVLIPGRNPSGVATRATQTKTTLWNLFFSYVGVAIGIIQGILLTPAYLKFIGAELYGAWLASGNILAWLTLLDPGIAGVMQQKVAAAHGRQERETVAYLASNGFRFTVLVVAAISLCGWLSGRFIGTWLDLGGNPHLSELRQAYYLQVVASGLMLFAYWNGNLATALQGTLAAGVVATTASLAGLASLLIFLHFGYGLLGIPASALVRGVIYNVGNTAYLVDRFRRENIRWQWWSPSQPQFALSLTLNALAKATSTIVNNIDFLVVSHAVSNQAVTIYSITRRGPDIARSLLERVSISSIPAISHLAGSASAAAIAQTIVRLFRSLIWVGAYTMGALVVGNAWLVRLWVGEEFYGGDKLSVVVICASGILLCYKAAADICWALGDLNLISRYALWQSLATGALLVVAKTWLPIYGVALSPALPALVVFVLLATRLERKLRPSPGEQSGVKAELRHAALALGLAGISAFLLRRIHVAEVVVCVVFTVLYLGTLGALSANLRVELRRLGRKLTKAPAGPA